LINGTKLELVCERVSGIHNKALFVFACKESNKKNRNYGIVGLCRTSMGYFLFQYRYPYAQLQACSLNWFVNVRFSVVDPDPNIFGPPGSGSISTRSGSFNHQAKIVRKTLIPTVLRLLFFIFEK
jgi:hypothetical protein